MEIVIKKKESSFITTHVEVLPKSLMSFKRKGIDFLVHIYLHVGYSFETILEHG